MKWFGSVALAVLPLVAGRAQTPTTPVADTNAPAKIAATADPVPDVVPAPAPSHFQTNVAEVVKLVQSGVGDEVVLAYVKNAKSPYNLTAKDILALKDAGFSSPVVAAMLNHDSALRAKRAQANSPQPGAPAAPVAAQPSSKPYTYEQKLYAPAPTADAQPGPASAPAAPSQPVIPAQPMAPAQPRAPAQPGPAAQPGVVVEQAPPAPQVEVVPASPGDEYYWVPGYWSWRHGGWVWIGGSWAPRPYHGAVWVGGRWGWRGHGYVWIGGHWR